MKKLSQIIKNEIEKARGTLKNQDEGGRVISFAENIVSAYGLFNAFLGEKVTFQSGYIGMIISIQEYETQIIVFNKQNSSILIQEGDVIYRAKKFMTVSVENNIISQVVDALGVPLNDFEMKNSSELPIFADAPSIISRKSVDTPLYTGTKIIDSMIPIGRGQRELIIGDRQTGKTTIAIDAILSQKQEYEKGKPVYCIYVAIGQKRSDIAQIHRTLQEHDVMKFTTIVCAPASDGAPNRYIAPYAGCAIAEYFRDSGNDVLIIYDDLSKHAVAYREISLLLRRSPGREAYPGDIFYVHASLLERAANLKDSGSLTALPIIETQAGDISAYVPTNVISITDGQIFLDSSAFNKGTRPAINVGLSVSRVGSAAQYPFIKKMCGKFKLYVSQAKELENFAKMSSDLDKETLKTVENGKKISMLMQQIENNPVSLQEAMIIFYIINKHLDLFQNNEQINKIMSRLQKKSGIWKLLNGKILNESALSEIDGVILACLKN